MKKILLKKLAPYLLLGILRILWLTCRVVKIEGEQHIEALLKSGPVFIPCYWHQHHAFGIYYMLQLKKRGVNLGFLISPSRDGDISAEVAQHLGAHTIRGSSHRTGARALRDLYNAITKQGISPVNTVDGPTGPVYVFKPGAIMLAQLTGKPLLPLSYAADRYWQLKSWDKFIIPKPFTRIAITVGAPQVFAKTLSAAELETACQRMQNTLQQLNAQAKSILLT